MDESQVEIPVTVPQGRDDVRLAADGVRGLVGQRAQMTVGGDWSRPLGMCEVAAATLAEDGSIALALLVAVSKVERMAGEGLLTTDAAGKVADGGPLASIGFRFDRVERDAFGRPTGREWSETRLTLLEVAVLPKAAVPRG